MSIARPCLRPTRIHMVLIENFQNSPQFLSSWLKLKLFSAFFKIVLAPNVFLDYQKFLCNILLHNPTRTKQRPWLNDCNTTLTRSNHNYQLKVRCTLETCKLLKHNANIRAFHTCTIILKEGDGNDKCRFLAPRRKICVGRAISWLVSNGAN